MIVAIEGIDAAGKSHMGGLLGARLAARGLRTALLDKHQLALDTSFADRRMAELRGIIWPQEAEPAEDALGTEFYLYLLASWFAGLKQVVPRHFGYCDVILTDGSFYRVIAKAHRRGGLALDWLERLFARALQPDMVVLLDIDPAQAWTRRTAFKATELGRWDGHSADARSAFCAYQDGVRETLLTLAERDRWMVVEQDAATTPEDAAERAEGAVVDGFRV